MTSLLGDKQDVAKAGRRIKEWELKSVKPTIYSIQYAHNATLRPALFGLKHLVDCVI